MKERIQKLNEMLAEVDVMGEGEFREFMSTLIDTLAAAAIRIESLESRLEKVGGASANFSVG